MMKTFFAIVLLAAAGSALFLYTRPTYDTLKTKEAEIASYDAALSKAAELQKIKQDLLTKYGSFRPEDKQRLEKLLPDHVDNVALILDIDHLAGQHGMGLENVDVDASHSGTAGSQSDASALVIVGADGGSKYDSLTITFGTRGTYQRFSDFIRDLQNSLRIVDLDSLSISAASGASTGSEPEYNYKVALRTYWLK